MEVIYGAYKVEKINEYLFTETYTSNEIKLGINELKVNDSEISMRHKAWPIPEILVPR